MNSMAPMKTNAAQTTRALTDCVNPIADLLRVYLSIIIAGGVSGKRKLCCDAEEAGVRISTGTRKSLKRLSKTADSHIVRIFHNAPSAGFVLHCNKLTSDRERLTAGD